ncbi:30S ribosomal protein S4e [Candidatus Woesearchaeota archaeon]|nr:30S ribosomal protein S4e [Candidatus Woesearchaeota archaeon]
MGKSHLKRLAAPKTWNVKRKGIKFIIKPLPGPHSLNTGMPLDTFLKEIFCYANTTREAKKILNAGEVKIDGKTRKDFRHPVGIFDIFEFTGTKEFFRVMLNRKGKLNLIKIGKEESALKPCKIINKIMTNGKLQLNLFDGRNVLVDKNSYKVGDTILLSLPEQKISKHLKLDKKSTVFLTGGRHIGEIGTIENVFGDKVIYKDEQGNLIETSKKYAFVVGEDKPSIALR